MTETPAAMSIDGRPHAGRVHRELLDGPAGRLELYQWTCARTASGRVILLPNGYGVLRYALSVAGHLADAGLHVTLPALRGQGRSDGAYSIPGATEDCAFVLDRISEGGGTFSILAHCSAVLPLIRLGPAHRLWRRIDRVVLYCYLAAPQLHVERFRHKCIRYGVRVADDLGDVSGFSPESYRSIGAPLHVYHPTDRTNLLRASVAEVESLRRAVPTARIAYLSSGYAINDRPQSASVRSTLAQGVRAALTQTPCKPTTNLLYANH